MVVSPGSLTHVVEVHKKSTTSVNKMDVSGCLIEVVPFIGDVGSCISKVVRKLVRDDLIPRLTGLALGLFFEETSNLHYVREFLSHATDIDHDTLVKLRQGYISECNSISVAVGFIIETYSTGSRNPHKSAQDEIDKMVVRVSAHLKENGIDRDNMTTQESTLVKNFLERLDGLDFMRDPLLTTALLLATPPQLLNQAAMSFLAGLGIYLGCSYTKMLNSGTGKGGGVALLIIYLPIDWHHTGSRFPYKGYVAGPQASDQSVGAGRSNEATVGHETVEGIEMSNLGARQSPQASTASRQVDGDNTSESRIPAIPVPAFDSSTGTSQETALPDTTGLAQGQAQALLEEAIEAQKHTTRAMEALLQLYQNKPTGNPPSIT
ncbi:hypothetical protein BDV97DRAFT_372745 [Delphinella strobiligena]|nr:hypothetical protein BDV97DRAFT_372745 [Delphinella strobiligena]